MELALLFGVLGGLIALVTVVLMRRGSSRTEGAEGLRIKDQARRQAAHHRVSYNARAMHNAMPTQIDVYQRRR
ncbi:hypothetical protein [Streptomyces sp. CC208A]|uniref:hypothetical protein n=1 Tax=Streptomyces sp. CC208A TaxID=3044573 RepID=UPI0024A8B4B9|nr:hypothetical protein [Streptomyces sp. CC208A]